MLTRKMLLNNLTIYLVFLFLRLKDSFDRKRRIAYYYPQRRYNFVSFDDEEDDSQGKHVSM